jgi:hypothetical protein
MPELKFSFLNFLAFVIARNAPPFGRMLGGCNFGII